MYTAEEFEHEGLRVRIIQDDDAQRPDEWEESVLLVFFADGMKLCPDGAPVSNQVELWEFVNKPERWEGVDRDDEEAYLEDLQEWESMRKGWRVFEVNANIHGGISLYLDEGDEHPMGALFIKVEDFSPDADFKAVAKSCVKEWNQYFEGDVWGYIVDKPVTCERCGNTEHEELDSCWGFYGLSDALEEAKVSAGYHADKG